jgi:hypothetical protein
MVLELVPEPFPLGARVRVFPDIIGVVVAASGSRRVVETDGGHRHEVGLGAIQLLGDDVAAAAASS